MPRRSERDTVEPTTPNKKAVNKRLRVGANGHKLPEPLPPGVVLSDVMKRKWKLGKSIGSGGFGEIYLVSEDSPAAVGPNAPYVVKIEHHTNGPLFAEMHFYHRVGKEESIQEWMKKKKLTLLGMPRFVASGSHDHKGIKYRFMVMDRFGEDLQKILDRCNRIFPQKTVFTLGMKILDILEYIHSYGYIHADVKASNLLLGFGKGNENKVFLIDFGLACRYITTDGKHKEYKPDLRKAHDGTIEFTSRDAHIGAHSRRGDLEILGYNMVQWLCGRLPWDDNLKVPDYVKEQKCGFMSKIPEFLTNCFDGKYPEGIAEYLQYIASLQFHQEPDYEHCRNILRNAIKKAGAKLDGKLVFNSPKKSPVRTTGSKCNKRAMNSDGEYEESPPSHRKKRGAPKMPSENHSNVTPPTPRRRKPHSAAPGLQSAKAAENCFGSMFDNPTPAMLLVMQRKLQLQQEEQLKKKVKPCVMEERESKSPEVKSSPERATRRSPRKAKGHYERTCSCCSPHSSRSQSPERNAKQMYRKADENLVYKNRTPTKKLVQPRRKSPALRSRSNSYSPEV